MPDQNVSPDLKPSRGRFRRTWSSATFVAGVVWLLGSVIRLTLRDSVPESAPVYYALPVPILLFCGGLWAVRAARNGRRRIVAVTCLLLGIQAVGWSLDVFRSPTSPAHGAENQFGAETNSQPVVAHDVKRVLFWNVCRGNLGYTAIAREIGASQADVVALVEATQDGQESSFWESELPGYSVTCLGGAMTLLTRGRNAEIAVDEIQKGQLPNQLRYRSIALRIEDQPVTIIIADVKSAPLNFRRPAFETLARISSDTQGGSVILVGDFNTPLDSVHVDLLRIELKNGFETAGEGYRETWPVVCPVLSLDQIWGSADVQFQRCWRESSLRSDHRRVLAEFSFVD